MGHCESPHIISGDVFGINREKIGEITKKTFIHAAMVQFGKVCLRRDKDQCTENKGDEKAPEPFLDIIGRGFKFQGRCGRHPGKDKKQGHDPGADGVDNQMGENGARLIILDVETGIKVKYPGNMVDKQNPGADDFQPVHIIFPLLPDEVVFNSFHYFSSQKGS